MCGVVPFPNKCLHHDCSFFLILRNYGHQQMRQHTEKGCHGSWLLSIADVESALSRLPVAYVCFKPPSYYCGKNKETETPVGECWYSRTAFKLETSVMITFARLCRYVCSVPATVVMSGVPDVLSAGRTVDEPPDKQEEKWRRRRPPRH